MDYRFSVVIPVYNRAALLPDCLAAFLEPSAAGLEVVVVDDGSRDDSAAVAEALAARSQGARIRVVRQANGGASAARNRGVAEVSSEWVAFLDSDDAWLPWSIATIQAVLADAGDAAMLFLRVVPFDRRDELAGLAQTPVSMGSRPSFLDCYLDPLLDLSGSCSVVVRRSAFLEAGGFDNRIRAAEDIDLFMRMSAAGPVLAILAPVILGLRRPGDDNLSTNHEAIREGLARICANHAAGRYAGPPDRLQAFLANFALANFWRALNSGHRAAAAGMLRLGSRLVVRRFGPLMLARCLWALAVAPLRPVRPQTRG